jgi:hypothetical protein
MISRLLDLSCGLRGEMGSRLAGGDEKKNCLLSQSHGAKPGNLDSNFSFVWFSLGSGFAVGETL